MVKILRRSPVSGPPRQTRSHDEDVVAAPAGPRPNFVIRSRLSKEPLWATILPPRTSKTSTLGASTVGGGDGAARIYSRSRMGPSEPGLDHHPVAGLDDVGDLHLVTREGSKPAWHEDRASPMPVVLR